MEKRSIEKHTPMKCITRYKCMVMFTLRPLRCGNFPDFSIGIFIARNYGTKIIKIYVIRYIFDYFFCKTIILFFLIFICFVILFKNENVSFIL